MTLLAIDGNSILNRAFYGIRMLTSSKGVPTNALFGFFNIYLKEAAQVQPDGVAVAFDLRSPTFRHKAVASYKANRCCRSCPPSGLSGRSDGWGRSHIPHGSGPGHS